MTSDDTGSERARLLSEHDPSLLADRYFVPIPRDGFVDEDEAVGKESERFEPLRTVPFVTAYALLLFVYNVIFLVFVFAASNENYTVIAATCHVPFLIGAGLLEGFVRLQHRRRQSLGYLNFYKQTRKLLPVPFQTAAYSVATMLVFVAFSSHSEEIKKRVRYFVSGVSLVEGFVIFVYWIWYTKRVRRHNRMETLPDAQQFLEAPLTTAPDTRRRRQDAVVDHQVEFIRCLQEQRDTLRGEVNRLRNMLGEAGKDSEAAMRKDDAEHLLAAGEQRMRALRAEAETSKKESEAAAKRVLEKEEEIHRLHELLEGQNHENNRLRASLAEWSKRHAKLEQKLIDTTQQLEQLVATPATSGASSIKDGP